MNQENLVESKVKKIRGTAHPYVGLEQAIGLVDQLRKAVGRGPFSRDVASQGLNHKSLSGPAMGKIAALVHFGLLSRQGNTYSVTPLADRILLPTSDEDRINAIVEAAKKPKLYKRLIDKYQNQSLPFLLDNILVREFGINEKRAKEVSKNFMKSLEYAGLLKNGVVTEKTVVDSSEDKATESVSPVSIPSFEPQKASVVSSSPYIVDLPSGIKIQFPGQMSFNVAVGDFSAGIKSLNDKANQLSKETKPKEETRG